MVGPPLHARPTAKDKARFASIDRRIEELLSDGKPHTRQELIELTGGSAVNSAITRLRKRGVPIGKAAKNRSGHWFYQLTARRSDPAGTWDDYDADDLVNQDVVP